MAVISDALVIAMMTVSVTGAGLVIAFYALVARLSARIFTNRFEQLGKHKQEVKKIANAPDSFHERNLKKTTSRLDDLRKEMESIKTFPKYLGIGVGVNFFVFLLSALFCFMWFYGIEHSLSNETSLVILFVSSIILFIIVGLSGIRDVYSVMSNDFEKLKLAKEEFRQDIAAAPLEADVVKKIGMILKDMKTDFQIAGSVKVGGMPIFPDIVIPTASSPKYVIEVMAHPSFHHLNNLSVSYMKIERTDINTILVSDFANEEELLRLAEAYFDYVVDMKDLDKLREIIRE